MRSIIVGGLVQVGRCSKTLFCIVLVGLFVLIVSAGKPYADTVSQTPTFSDSGSAWSGGGVANQSFYKQFTLDLSGTAGFNGILEPEVAGVSLGDYGAAASVSSSGTVGV